MRAVSIVLVLVISLGLPGLALLWLYRSRARSRLHLSLVFLFAAVLLIATVLSYGYWFAVGMYWPVVLATALAGIVAIRVRRGLPEAWLPRHRSEVLLSALAVVLTLVAGAALPFVVLAKSYEGEALELGLPLRGGTFVIMAGGANWSTNQRAYTAPDSGRYALDIAGLNRMGMRAAGLSPAELDAFVAFGKEVIAPCAGEVVEVEGGLPDRPPLSPATDSSYGNHVVLCCLGDSVVLGHLEAGSIAVRVGDRVERGQLLGVVGNSGGTLEPHLHIHAVAGRHGPDHPILAEGTAVPVRLGGRFLIKHDRFEN